MTSPFRYCIQSDRSGECRPGFGYTRAVCLEMIMWPRVRTMSARNYQNPNSTMSLAYAWHFSMTVKNGILHDERGNRGMGDFYEINGTIAADGTAAIRADGITGKGTSTTGMAT